MAGAFTAVDLSQLPFPDAVEPLDYETILAEMLADLVARDPTFTAMVESDPAHKVLQVAAFREVLLRQRVNESIKAVSLAHAIGVDLDVIAARYGVQRLLLDAGNPEAIPPIAPTYEDDTSLRRRVQLAFEGFSTAGPEGSYIFHALGADADVLDAAVTSPTPGVVTVAVLSRDGGGAAGPTLVAAVNTVLNGKEVRPLTDNVTVQSATIVNYAVSAQLYLFDGPDSSVVVAEATASMQAYADRSHRLGRDVTLSGIYAALHVEGVQRVVLASPSANVTTAWNQAPYCTGITLTVAGIDD